jgi:hypothetical protein
MARIKATKRCCKTTARNARSGDATTHGAEVISLSQQPQAKSTGGYRIKAKAGADLTW